MPERLPVYRLEAYSAETQRLIDLGRTLFEVKEGFTLQERDNSRVLRQDHRVVEIHGESGGIWAADESQLFKPSIRPKLLGEKEAVKKVTSLLRAKKLLPELSSPFRLSQPKVAGTRLAMRTGRRREERMLDVQVIYPVMVGEIPIVGGGGDFTAVLGDKGRLTGFSGVWRRAVDSFDAKVIERKFSDEQFRAMTKDMKIESFDASLAYYSAPSFHKQEFLYPVYVYSGTARFGKHRVPLRQMILPATDFGPKVSFGEPQPPRPKEQAAGTGRQPTKKYTRALPRRSYATLSPWRPWEAGTSWIGQSGGLAGSQANAQGFVDEWAAAGWNVNFNWGDGNAFESDWRRNDDQWVDAADFVFYTGHASLNGWVLSNPDDGSLDFTEVGGSPGSPGDLWGQNDLEWAVVAACGPLQDELLASGGGDVLDRWDGAFDGMHILLGYGAITFDNTDEGRKLAQYAKGGSTLIDAWFRTAKEIQPSTNGAGAPDGPTVWVGAMWVGKNGVDPSGDHAWGCGSVSGDPTNPTFLACMWTVC
jgi:hypothetical protein